MKEKQLKSTTNIKIFAKEFERTVNEILKQEGVIEWTRFNSVNCWISEPYNYNILKIILIKSYDTIVAFHEINYGTLYILRKYSRTTSAQVSKYIRQTQYPLEEVVHINEHTLQKGE